MNDTRVEQRRRVYLGSILANMEMLLMTYDESDDEMPILQEYSDYVAALLEECKQAE